jgi:hypothetical protein
LSTGGCEQKSSKTLENTLKRREKRCIDHGGVVNKKRGISFGQIPEVYTKMSSTTEVLMTRGRYKVIAQASGHLEKKTSVDLGGCRPVLET